MGLYVEVALELLRLIGLTIGWEPTETMDNGHLDLIHRIQYNALRLNRTKSCLKERLRLKNCLK